MGGYRELGRGYGWCFAVAMAYAAAFIFMPWGLAGRGTGLGDWVLVPDTVQPWWQRGAFLLALAIAGIIVLLTFRPEKAIDARFGDKLKALLTRLGLRSDERSANLANGVMVFVFVFSILIGGRWSIGMEVTADNVAFALAGVGAFAFADSGAFAVVVAIAVGGAGAGAIAGGGGSAFVIAAAFVVAVAGGVAGATPGATAVAVAGGVAGATPGATAVAFAGGVGVLALALAGLGLTDPNAALAFALFLAVLPLVNALLDWPSWLVSRWLGRHLLESLDGSRLQQLRNLVLHGTADLMAAIAFLVVLAIILPQAVGFFVDLVVRRDPSLDATLAPYFCATDRNPLGAGFWASAMLLSTLLPTALHLMFLVASPIAFWLRPHAADWQARAAYLAGHRTEPPEIDLPRNPALRDTMREKPSLDRETVRKVAWWRIRQIFLIYPAAFVAGGLILWGIWHLIQSITGPLPAWLLWFATFDTAFVEACLPGAF